MTYLTKVIQPSETLIYAGKVTWVIYLRGLCLVGLGIGLSSVHPALALIAALGVLSLLGAWIRRWTTEIAVTNKRVIYKIGLVRRRTVEMNISKIESVDVDQSVAGRILNFGTVLIRGTGGSLEPMRAIDEPLALRNALLAPEVA